MAAEHSEHCLDKKKLLEDIQNLGWAVILVEATAYLPSFAYTIGLWKNYSHPEIISFGLSIQTLHLLLNDAAERVKSGQTIQEQIIYDDYFEKGSVQYLRVNPRNIADYFGQAINLYTTEDFPALQLVWTDRQNRFPWERNYEQEFEYRQPLLDRNADFKFREEKNLGVFTSKQCTKEHKAILRVVHDDEGDWQFLAGDELPEDIAYVALEELVKADPSLNEVFNLDYGETAERRYVGDRWVRGVLNSSDEEEKN